MYPTVELSIAVTADVEAFCYAVDVAKRRRGFSIQRILEDRKQRDLAYQTLRGTVKRGVDAEILQKLSQHEGFREAYKQRLAEHMKQG